MFFGPEKLDNFDDFEENPENKNLLGSVDSVSQIRGFEASTHFFSAIRRRAMIERYEIIGVRLIGKV